MSQIIKNNEFQEAKNIVDLYSSGEEYLEKEEIYDVTFVDIEMPGIDGFETIRRARKYNANGIYIILTNHIEMSNIVCNRIEEEMGGEAPQCVLADYLPGEE